VKTGFGVGVALRLSLPTTLLHCVAFSCTALSGVPVVSARIFRRCYSSICTRSYRLPYSSIISFQDTLSTPLVHDT